MSLRLDLKDDFFRYGWHFPELGKIITDNLAFVRTVDLMGIRESPLIGVRSCQRRLRKR